MLVTFFAASGCVDDGVVNLILSIGIQAQILMERLDLEFEFYLVTT